MFTLFPIKLFAIADPSIGIGHMGSLVNSIAHYSAKSNPILVLPPSPSSMIIQTAAACTLTFNLFYFALVAQVNGVSYNRGLIVI